MVTKAHIKGAIAAIATAATMFGGTKAYHLYQVVKTVEVLTQQVATDQKSGQQFTVVDVLQAVAADKLQQIQQQQKQQAK